jgi:acetate kinase
VDRDGRALADPARDRKIQPGHQGAIDHLLIWGKTSALSEHTIVAVGHRVVHGGRNFSQPVRMDPAVLDALDALVPLAPLHQPHCLAGIRAVAAVAPQLPQVACFDTAFHHTQLAIARALALPRRLTEQGLQRYGFHGLSYEYIASVLPEFDAAAAAGRTVVAHLGNGASMCALRNGRSVATTMGFSALDGLPMGTRCGSIDPGVLFYLMDQHHMSVRDLERVLYSESGLLGVSGLSSDMRTLLESSSQHAAEAVELFVYRIGRELGSLAAALEGLDAIVFTGGIGEHASKVRARVCRTARWLGVELDENANAAGGPRVSQASSRVTAWVIATNEELMIARHMVQLLGVPIHH